MNLKITSFSSLDPLAPLLFDLLGNNTISFQSGLQLLRKAISGKDDSLSKHNMSESRTEINGENAKRHFSRNFVEREQPPLLSLNRTIHSLSSSPPPIDAIDNSAKDEATATVKGTLQNLICMHIKVLHNINPQLVLF